MTTKKIVALINEKLAGEQLTYNDLKQFMDNVIDDINSKLNTIYPAFSELEGYDVDYNMFPDRFIRSVVVPGAAWYYYVADEEGSPTAQQYNADYNKGLLTMQRDMLYNIPVEYQADSMQGTVETVFDPCPNITIPYGAGEW
jgi:hypothetical protein